MKWMALFVFLLLISCSGPDQGDLGTIDGIPLAKRLFRGLLEKRRAEVYESFYKRFQAQPEPGFWTTRYGTEVPLDVARQKALDEATGDLSLLSLAQKRGLVSDPGYNAILAGWNEENQRRKAKAERGEALYGPLHFTEEVYFQYWLSNIRLQLKDLLAKREIAVSDSEIVQFYEASKSRLFARKVVVAEAIQLPGTDEKDSSTDLVGRIASGVKSGESFANLVQEFHAKRAPFLRTFDSEIRHPDTEERELRRVAFSLQRGQVSAPLPLQNGIWILRCTDIRDEGFRPLEDVRQSVGVFLADQKFEEFLTAIKNKAAVRIDRNALEQIPINDGALTEEVAPH